MKAISYRSFGPAADVLSLIELSRPEVEAGDVLVRLAASGVNPADFKNRSGMFPFNAAYFEGEPGFVIPHSDGAGVIEAVGADVPPSRVGQRVWTRNAQWQRPFGTLAEFVVLPARLALPLPQGVSFEAGACFGIPLLTAFHAVTLAGELGGKTVLIAGGAGSVGVYAIQIAKALGATVVATVSGDEKAKFAREHGADHVVNYRAQDVAEEVAKLTVGRGVDHVVEVNLSVNGSSLADVLTAGGSAAIYGSDGLEATLPAIGLLVKAARLNFFLWS